MNMSGLPIVWAIEIAAPPRVHVCLREDNASAPIVLSNSKAGSLHHFLQLLHHIHHEVWFHNPA